jgi:hypothetical protein
MAGSATQRQPLSLCRVAPNRCYPRIVASCTPRPAHFQAIQAKPIIRVVVIVHSIIGASTFQRFAYDVRRNETTI